MVTEGALPNADGRDDAALSMVRSLAVMGELAKAEAAKWKTSDRAARQLQQKREERKRAAE